MAKISLIQTNFTAGEISPRLMGRVDIARYGNGATKIENGVILVHGGVIRRPGSRYISATKYSDKASRLIPYVFNRKQAYMLEFGDKYMRVYQDGRLVLNDDNEPYEVETPYAADDLYALTYVQGADTMFIAHHDYPVHQLQRLNHDDWQLDKTDFDVEPFAEIRPTPETTCKPDKISPVGELTTLTLGAAGWDAAKDVGAYVRLNRGLVRLTKINNAASAVGEIRAVMDAAVAAPKGAWTREHTVWDEEQGYPGAITLHEQRLVTAGSRSHPQTVWLSRTGDYFNFELGTEDDDAASFTISSNQLNPIVHMSQTRSLIALTFGGEFSMVGGVEKPITPTNIQVRDQSPFGCSSVRPVRVGAELMFVQRANRKLKGIGSGYYGDDYIASTLTTLSEHITESGIVDMTYQQEPESVIWCVRGDGQMATLTMDREQEVMGWARQVTDGKYQSVATIPTATGDDVYAIVERVIDGSVVRCVERMDSDLHTDAAVIGEDSEGATAWVGLEHLEGKVVDVVADGVVMSQQVVRDGEITIERKAKHVQIGLHYDTTIETLTPEIQGGEGTAQGSAMSIHSVTLRVLDTTGIEINGSVIPFREFGKQVLNEPAPLFSGDKDISQLGWRKGEATNVIQQRQPLPFHLLAVIIGFTTNRG